MTVVACQREGELRLCSLLPVAGLDQAYLCRQSAADCDHKPVVGVVEGGDAAAIEAALAAWGFCVEITRRRPLMGDNLRPVLEGRGLYLALSTASAYGVEPARLFSQVLAGRLGLAEEWRETVELALHEALVNGLIHGNLELTSAGRQTVESFTEYCSSVEQRLADPVLAARVVEVFALWDGERVSLSVEDGGKGYDPALRAQPGDDPRRKSGRGLLLIESLAEETAIAAGGRRITMRFPR